MYIYECTIVKDPILRNHGMFSCKNAHIFNKFILFVHEGEIYFHQAFISQRQIIVLILERQT